MKSQTTARGAPFAFAAFASAGDDARREWRYLALMLAVVVVPSLLVDMLVTDSVAAFLNCVLALLTLYIQLAITFRMLHLHGAAPEGYHPSQVTRGRFSSVFVAGLFADIAILLGLLLLIVPGIILLLLFSLSNVVIAAEDLGATDGLKRSWALVRPALGGVALVVSTFILAVAAVASALLCATYWLPVNAGSSCCSLTSSCR